MIRLPKATKTPVKSKLVPRQSLATIVKDLGKNAECDEHTEYEAVPHVFIKVLYCL